MFSMSIAMARHLQGKAGARAAVWQHFLCMNSRTADSMVGARLAVAAGCWKPLQGAAAAAATVDSSAGAVVSLLDGGARQCLGRAAGLGAGSTFVIMAWRGVMYQHMTDDAHTKTMGCSTPKNSSDASLIKVSTKAKPGLANLQCKCQVGVLTIRSLRGAVLT